MENSTEGVVARSLDLFLRSPVHVVGEVSLQVRFNLLRQLNSDAGIEVVMAHPQALAQCQGWLSKHLPHVERRAVSSNAEGARLAATNPAWAALASERAASQFGLHIVHHAIQDEAFNRTRFAVISLPQTLATPPASGKDCTSLVVSVPNRPGAVHDLLVPLKNNGVSMTRFESRPPNRASGSITSTSTCKATSASRMWPPLCKSCKACARSTRCWVLTLFLNDPRVSAQ
jgi:chorismate mutase / prephenate dehydratase